MLARVRLNILDNIRWFSGPRNRSAHTQPSTESLPCPHTGAHRTRPGAAHQAGQKLLWILRPFCLLPRRRARIQENLHEPVRPFLVSHRLSSGQARRPTVQPRFLQHHTGSHRKETPSRTTGFPLPLLPHRQNRQPIGQLLPAMGVAGGVVQGCAGCARP